jgi:hypothetical protein
MFRAVTRDMTADMIGAEPNWPKIFLVGHSIELAIQAYLAYAKQLSLPRPPGPEPANHDLSALYAFAVARGLAPNSVVTNDLAHLSELHKTHYARYPAYEAKPVAMISQFDDMVDQLFDDVAAAISRANISLP